MTRAISIPILSVLVACPYMHAQQGTRNGEWRYYGGDSGATKYSPLDQINAGKPVWPIEEREDLIDFTPDLKGEAIKTADQYKLGPLYTPLILRDTNGKLATLMLPHHVGGGRGFVGIDDGEGGGRAPQRTNSGPQGLPLVKHHGDASQAIGLNAGEHRWTAAKGETPEYIRNHPALKGIDLSNGGKPSRSLLMVTKTLLSAPEGNNLWVTPAGGGVDLLRILDKATGKMIHQFQLPAMATGVPMTYMADDRQFVVVAVGATGAPAELIALPLA